VIGAVPVAARIRSTDHGCRLTRLTACVDAVRDLWDGAARPAVPDGCRCRCGRHQCRRGLGKWPIGCGCAGSTSRAARPGSSSMSTTSESGTGSCRAWAGRSVPVPGRPGRISRAWPAVQSGQDAACGAADLTQIRDGARTGACAGQTQRPLSTTSWARAAVYSFLSRAATGRLQVSQVRTPAVGIGAPSVRLVTVTRSLLVIARPGDISP
jgi:hypothetical protein